MISSRSTPKRRQGYGHRVSEATYLVWKISSRPLLRPSLASHFVQMHQALKGTHPLTDVETNTVGAASDALKARIANTPRWYTSQAIRTTASALRHNQRRQRGVFIDLPSMDARRPGQSQPHLAHYVSVYDGFIRTARRDFASGQWLTEYEGIHRHDRRRHSRQGRPTRLYRSI